MSIVTFLFTDIEGSTRRWEADADAMRVALETHNQVLREAVEANDGQVFNYTGDGMCAVFASPRSAVDAAVAAQRALELPVRMGIATGEAELRGDDYFGTVLNRTARVMAAGHGGQILLDGATAGLISGVDLMSLGPRRLRDIAKPVDVFQVQSRRPAHRVPTAEDRRSDTGKPPATKHHLRRPGVRTRRVGRGAQGAPAGDANRCRRRRQNAACDRSRRPRSADRLPRRRVGDRAGRVGDPAAVPDAVAAPLGIIQQPGMSLTDSIAAALEGRSRLLIFDNCEHLLSAAADLIEAILARSDTVRVLATSREGLRVEEEQLWPVSSLDTNSGVDSSAASLFLDRAHTVARGVPLIRRQCRGGDMPTTRRDSIGHRVGRLSPALHVRHRTAGSARRPIPPACRIAPRPGTPPDSAPRRAMVIRPTRR